MTDGIVLDVSVTTVRSGELIAVGYEEALVKLIIGDIHGVHGDILLSAQQARDLATHLLRAVTEVESEEKVDVN